MNLLSDIITYVRRIIKSPSNSQISDALIIDYINRFWIMDVDARIQLFDLKTKYQFQTAPGYDQYNMPMYGLQTEASDTDNPQIINYYPMYQGFLDAVYINGIQVPFQTDKTSFFNIWPNIVQQMNVVTTGTGGSSYTFTFPIAPNNSNPVTTPFQYLLRGHVDLGGIIQVINSNSGVGYSDPPNVTNTQALTTIPAVLPSNTFAAVYITSNGVDGSNIVVSDSGQFLSGQQNYGLLMAPGTNGNANSTLTGGYSATITGATQANPCVLTCANSFQSGQFVTINNVSGMTELNGNTYEILSASATSISIDVDSTGFTAYTSGGTASTNFINYFTGQVNVTFPTTVPAGANINAQCYLFQSGLPRGVLFYDNTLTLRSPPSQQYLVELDAYLTPAGFLATGQSIQFAYMSEYIARGAARKILADTGDVEQFNFYEPFFKEQEMLVWKRSQRQFTASRTQTIYSQGINQGQSGFNNLGGSTL